MPGGGSHVSWKAAWLEKTVGLRIFSSSQPLNGLNLGSVPVGSPSVQVSGMPENPVAATVPGPVKVTVFGGTSIAPSLRTHVYWKVPPLPV